MSERFDTAVLKVVGEDVWISNTVSIRRPHLVSIGTHVAIDEFFVGTTALELGDYIHISTHVSVIGGEKGLLKMGHFTNIATKGTIICASDSFLGDGLITAPHIPDEYRDTIIAKPIIFENFVNIGANVTIFPGVTLPEGVVIGACSLVRPSDTLEPWTVYAGNPLRAIKKRPMERMKAYAAALGYT